MLNIGFIQLVQLYNTMVAPNLANWRHQMDQHIYQRNYRSCCLYIVCKLIWLLYLQNSSILFLKDNGCRILFSSMIFLQIDLPFVLVTLRGIGTSSYDHRGLGVPRSQNNLFLRTVRTIVHISSWRHIAREIANSFAWCCVTNPAPAILYEKTSPRWNFHRCCCCYQNRFRTCSCGRGVPF